MQQRITSQLNEQLYNLALEHACLCDQDFDDTYDELDRQFQTIRDQLTFGA